MKKLQSFQEFRIKIFSTFSKKISGHPNLRQNNDNLTAKVEKKQHI
jgi:hypothetical protein